MARYDDNLREARGTVHAGSSPNRNDYLAAGGYSRDFRPRDLHYWRRPWELRGDIRAGSAYTYGFGNDYDVVYRRGRERNDRGSRSWAQRYDLGFLRGMSRGIDARESPPRLRDDRGMLRAGRYGPDAAHDRDPVSRGHTGTYFMGGYDAPYDREYRGGPRRHGYDAGW